MNKSKRKIFNNSSENRVELHLHTKLSDSISTISAEDAINFALSQNCKAIAVTNLNNAHDFPYIENTLRQFSRKSDYKDLKIIYGAEIRYENHNREPFGMTLIAKNQNGIKELYKIISSLDKKVEYNFISSEVLESNRSNVFCGSCGNMSELYRAVNNNLPQYEIEQIALLYDYFELFPTDDENERKVYQKIYDLGKKLGKAVVAVGNCHYEKPEDQICRKIIAFSRKMQYEDNKKFYLYTTDEMLKEFSYLGKEAAFEVVVTNTNLIADMIEKNAPTSKEFPSFEIPNAYNEIFKRSYNRAYDLYGKNLPKIVGERLNQELTYIEKNEFSSYYLIAQKMVEYMNNMGYYVGARGTVSSSFTAYLLGITDVNPLIPHYYCPKCHHAEFITDNSVGSGFDLPDKLCPVCNNPLTADGHNIPYEMFMGFNGDKVPDIDLNFPASMQEKQFEFLQNFFGKDRTAMAGTIGTLAYYTAKKTILYYEEGNNVYFDSAEKERIIEKIQGTKHSCGIHPAGVVVLPKGKEFCDYTPLRKIENSFFSYATHFDFHSLINNIIKLDVLGYDIIDIFKLLEKFSGKSINDVQMNDQKIYKLFEGIDVLGITPEDINGITLGTLGLPEFYTDFVMNIVSLCKPKRFSDLVKICGFAHGTNVWLNNCDELIKSGKHTLGELPALRDDIYLDLQNYGIEKSTAFRLSEAVRRGILRFKNKNHDEIVSIMCKAGVPEWYIQVLNKIRYIFPKAHSAAYVMNAVRLAWFKLYYPVEFYAAYISVWFSDNEIDFSILPQGDKVVKAYLDVLKEEFGEESRINEFYVESNKYIAEKNQISICLECMARGMKFLPPQKGKSHEKYFLPENGNIRLPMCVK